MSGEARLVPAFTVFAVFLRLEIGVQPEVGELIAGDGEVSPYR